MFLFFFVVVNVFSSRSLFEQFFVASEFKPINTRPMNFNDPPEIKDTPFVLSVRFSTSLGRPRMVVRHPPNRRRCLPWFFFYSIAILTSEKLAIILRIIIRLSEPDGLKTSRFFFNNTAGKQHHGKRLYYCFIAQKNKAVLQRRV